MRFRIAKGDVSGAFLQGRSYQDDAWAYVVPTDEIRDAMSIPAGSITKLKKACFGLVDAPLEWFLSSSRHRNFYSPYASRDVSVTPAASSLLTQNKASLA